MLEEFAYLGKEKAYEVVVTNTQAIADQVETFPLLPEELFPPRLENSEEELNSLVWNKVHELYGEDPVSYTHLDVYKRQEDDLKQAEKDLQKLTDDSCKELDALLAKKEKELMAV